MLCPASLNHVDWALKENRPSPPHLAPGRVGEKRKVEPMGFYCACCMHGSDWLGPECKRSGKLVVSVFGDFARQWGYAYDMTMWQFFNIEQTSLSGLHAGRKANSVIHRWLFQGDALLILTFGGRHPLCLVIREGVRPASAGRECLAAFQTPCRSIYTHHVPLHGRGRPRVQRCSMDTCIICAVPF